MTNKMPWIMGGMMGLMLPFMIHNGVGWGFVAAHVAVIVLLGLAVVAFPKRPMWLSRILSHRPDITHLTKMGVAMVMGFAIVCLACLSLGGVHHA